MSRYQPKPYSPGAFVLWTHDRHHFPRQRHGVVWSRGPLASSLWVVPDVVLEGEAPAVLVRFSAKRRTAWSDHREQQLSTARYQQALLAAYEESRREPLPWGKTVHQVAEARALELLRHAPEPIAA